MRNLVAAGFERYRKNKWFWVILIALIILGGIGGMFTEKLKWGLDTEFIYTFFLVHLALVYAYVVQEWNGGVIRNKIILGYKKSVIFLSEIVLHSCTLLILWFGFWIPYTIFELSVLEISMSQLGYIFIVMVLLCISHITIVVTIQYSIPFKVGGIIANVFIIYAMDRSFVLHQELQTMFPLEQACMCSNYLVSYRIFKEVDPEILQYMEGIFYKYPIYSIGLMILIGGIGMFIFQRQDIK